MLLSILEVFFFVRLVSCVTKLRAPDAYKGDQFGHSSAIYENYLVLSAIGDDDFGSYTGRYLLLALEQRE
jgi:hypothetical protein